MQCHRCHSSGTIVAHSKKNQALYAFRCYCNISSARGLSMMIPTWGSKYANDFVPDFDSSEPILRPVAKPKEDIKMKQANDFDAEDLPW